MSMVTCVKFKKKHCVRALSIFTPIYTCNVVIQRLPRQVTGLLRNAFSMRRHNERHGVLYHEYLDCFVNRLFRHKSKKISKLYITGLCGGGGGGGGGNPPETGVFNSQGASNTEHISSWLRHRVFMTISIHLRNYFSALSLESTSHLPFYHILTCLSWHIFSTSLNPF